MRAPVAAAAAFVLIGVTSSEAAGQSVSDVFDRVHRSVVVIRTLERDIDEQRPAVVSSVGSGVLISSDGKVLTAAHLVGTAEAIRVEFPGTG